MKNGKLSKFCQNGATTPDPGPDRRPIAIVKAKTNASEALSNPRAITSAAGFSIARHPRSISGNHGGGAGSSDVS